MTRFLPLMVPSAVSEAAANGAPVFVPIGTVEINGPHLPLGYDYLVAAELAMRAATETNGVALPPLAFGVSQPLDSFAGTIAVPPDVLRDHVQAVLFALVRQGFRTIIVLNNHIPNQYPVEQAIRAVRRDTDVLVPSITPSQIANDIYIDLYGPQNGALGHGGEPGTSLMLALFPDAVRTDLAEPTQLSSFRGFHVLSPLEIAFQQSRVSLFLDVSDVSDSGGWGDASSASAERGREVFDRMVRFVCDFAAAYAGQERAETQ